MSAPYRPPELRTMAAVMGGRHMAVTHYSPLPDSIDDPVSYEEASALFARTGHPASAETIRRWVHEEQLETVRIKRRDYASWSDILEVHGRRTAVKLRASSNWP